VRGHTGRLRQRVNNKDLLVFGCIMDARSGAAVEAYHEAGYDVLLIDREHTALNSETVLEHIRLARALDFPCMVRVAEDCYHELGRTLDQAPDGIFVPRIRSRAQVESLVRMVKYPPLGMRGLAGSSCPAGKYVGWKSVAEQIECVNRDLVVGIQIETVEALDDLDGILSVPGVDIAVVGPDDLSAGMGIPGQLTAPEYVAAVERVIGACRRHNVLPGIAGGDPAAVRQWIERGMRAIWYAADVCLLWQAATQQLSKLHEALAGLDLRERAR
jgi:2-keto-3-deoxy-L-rhamnonate aldolase RhmA